MKGAEAVEVLLNHEQIAEKFSENKDELLTKIKENVRDAISKVSPKKSLSFQLFQNGKYVKTVEIAADLEYAKVLIAYLFGTQYKNYKIDSCVTPIALEATQNAILEFYTNDEAKKIISGEIQRQLSQNNLVNSSVSKEIKKNQDWIKHEINGLMHGEAATSIAGEVLEKTTDSVVAFFSTAMGQKMLVLIAKFLATGAGKAVLHQIGVVVGHALATGAFKSVLLMGIKKIGVSVLIKTAVGKAIVGLLALLGITASIPAAWIIVPIIAVILIYDYQTFPEKLAEKIPEEIEKSISSEFNTMNKSLTKDMLRIVMEHVINHIVEIKKVPV